MLQELKFQLSTAILTILTLAAGVAAIINFDQQRRTRAMRGRRWWGGVFASLIPTNAGN